MFSPFPGIEKIELLVYAVYVFYVAPFWALEKLKYTFFGMASLGLQVHQKFKLICCQYKGH